MAIDPPEQRFLIFVPRLTEECLQSVDMFIMSRDSIFLRGKGKSGMRIPLFMLLLMMGHLSFCRETGQVAFNLRIFDCNGKIGNLFKSRGLRLLKWLVSDS
jgi:hypothetical protein